MKNIIIIASTILLSASIKADTKFDNPELTKEFRNTLSNPILAESTFVSKLTIDNPKLIKVLTTKKEVSKSKKVKKLTIKEKN